MHHAGVPGLLHNAYHKVHLQLQASYSACTFSASRSATIERLTLPPFTGMTVLLACSEKHVHGPRFMRRFTSEYQGESHALHGHRAFRNLHMGVEHTFHQIDQEVYNGTITPRLSTGDLHCDDVLPQYPESCLCDSQLWRRRCGRFRLCQQHLHRHTCIDFTYQKVC